MTTNELIAMGIVATLVAVLLITNMLVRHFETRHERMAQSAPQDATTGYAVKRKTAVGPLYLVVAFTDRNRRVCFPVQNVLKLEYEDNGHVKVWERTTAHAWTEFRDVESVLFVPAGEIGGVYETCEEEERIEVAHRSDKDFFEHEVERVVNKPID